VFISASGRHQSEVTSYFLHEDGIEVSLTFKTEDACHLIKISA